MADQACRAPRAIDVRLLDPEPFDVESIRRALKQASKSGTRWTALFDAVVREVESLRRARRLGQRYAAEKARVRQAQLAEVGVASVEELVLRLHAALADLHAWEEREAACCPEDVGFEEYIAVLKKRLKDPLAVAAVGEASR